MSALTGRMLLVAGLTAGIFCAACDVADRLTEPDGPSTTRSTPTPQPTTPTNTPTSAPPSWTQTFEEVRDGVVHVAAPDCEEPVKDLGSGFVMNEDLVVTAAHVVGKYSRPTLETPKGSVEGDVVALDPATDLALIRTRYPLKGYAFQITDKPAGIGDEVAALGFPVQGDFSATTGRVTSWREFDSVDGNALRMVQTDAAINPGNSGGPVIGIDGRIQGTAVSKFVLAGGDPVDNVAFAVPPDVLAAKLDNWRAEPERSLEVVVCGRSDSAVESFLTEPGSQGDELPYEEQQVLDVLTAHGEAINEGRYVDALATMTEAMRGKQRPAEGWAAGMRAIFWEALLVDSIVITRDEAEVRLTLASTNQEATGMEDPSCTQLPLDYTLKWDAESEEWLMDSADATADPTPCEPGDV